MAEGDSVRKPARRRRAREAAPTTPDPIDIAMQASASGKPAQGAALDLLVEQRRLIRWQTAGEQAGFALKVMTGLVGLVIVTVLAEMAWRASQDQSVVVRAFSTPPAYVARGLTGDILAARFMDDLVLIRQKTARVSIAPTQDLRADGGEAIRIEIPQTGVSLGEIQRLFDRWLSHQIVIAGAASEETPGVVTLSARTGRYGTVRVSGPADQLDSLIQQLAEKSFAAYVPDQWAIYLSGESRYDEALAAARANALNTEARDWTVARDYSIWGTREGDPARQIRLYRKALALQPKLISAQRNLARGYERIGNEQAAFDAATHVLELKRADQPRLFHRDIGVDKLRRYARYMRAKLSGAYADARALAEPGADESLAAARTHDSAAARQILADALEVEKITPRDAAFTRVHIADAAADWPAMAAAMTAYEREREAAFNAPPAPGLTPPAGSPVMQAQYAALRARRDAPLLARALARSGDIVRARAVAAATPLDCAACLRARAEVESAAHNWAGADAWFARASAFAPRLPQAETLWGESLLARGDAAGAVAKLSAAAAKAPRSADPLELWGEALMQQGRFAPATARLAQAAKLAPRWGRLHLMWGEALAAQGKADEARATWQAAARMDLAPADAAALACLRALPANAGNWKACRASARPAT